MFTLKQKIFGSYLIAIAFIVLVLSFSYTYMSSYLRENSMKREMTKLIGKFQEKADKGTLGAYLAKQKTKVLFRITLYEVMDSQALEIYDTIRETQREGYIENDKEVLWAVDDGIGYSDRKSASQDIVFHYLAERFMMQGKEYVVRIAYPQDFFGGITQPFQMAMLWVLFGMLSLILLSWFWVYQLLKPVQRVLEGVLSYQETHPESLPLITIRERFAGEDILKLVRTLNSLSRRVQSQIDTLTEERNDKEVLLTSLVEGVIAVDEKMVVTYANPMAMRLFGFQLEDLIHQPFQKTGQTRCTELLEQCQKKESPLMETLHLQMGGEKLFLDVVAAPKRGQHGAILVLQDKTSHYKVLEMRKSFVANASHELKTPITIIQGFAETLYEHPEMPVETTREVTQKIVANCQRMANLVRDLLALADIENLPSSRWEQFPLQLLVDQYVEELAEVFPEATVTLQWEPSEEMMMVADPELIGLALRNLLTNAAKYSSGPAEITVLLKQSEDETIIKVADQGIGIPTEALDKIFERFYRVPTTSSGRKGGSGLGLSILQTIVDKHFGKIQVESQEGVGSTFTLIFPRKKI